MNGPPERQSRPGERAAQVSIDGDAPSVTDNAADPILVEACTWCGAHTASTTGDLCRRCSIILARDSLLDVEADLEQLTPTERRARIRARREHPGNRRRWLGIHRRLRESAKFHRRPRKDGA